MEQSPSTAVLTRFRVRSRRAVRGVTDERLRIVATTTRPRNPFPHRACRPRTPTRQPRSSKARGWNSAERDALRDAAIALASMREHFDAAKIVVVGHSMGGRVAAHLSASGDVGAVVALAPWWLRDDADLIPNTCRLLVMHGTADTWTDPHSSYIGRPSCPRPRRRRPVDTD